MYHGFAIVLFLLINIATLLSHRTKAKIQYTQPPQGWELVFIISLISVTKLTEST